MGKISTNTIGFGTILGVIVPAVFFVIVYLFRETELSFMEYMRTLYFLKVLPKLMSLCLLPNLVLFFVFLWSDRLRAAQGVILSLFIIGLPIVVLKFI